MSLSILAQGTLTADPVQRTSAAGKPFVTCQIRVATEDGSILVSVICFEQVACDKLSRLKKGDAVAVSGRAKPTTWEKNGEQRHGKAKTRVADPEAPWQPPESSLEPLQ